MNLQSIKQRFGIIGASKKLDQALDTATRVANTDLTVLISGESGVGKEVFSKIIHALSPRKHNNFISVNCGAIPAGTINSELFGHEKGAFTGATSDRKGYFEAVDGGTIFLDEIGEMPLDTQTYLLRILENGEYIRVGANKPQKTDVRVIAATNRSLEERVRNGKFREDLYFRLNTIPIKVPALRERPEDIYLLFRKFASDFGEKYRRRAVRLDERARLLLENYQWPGNIRELKNVTEQISVLTEADIIDAQDLIEFLPNINKRNLPATATQSAGNGDSFQEREILYKLLFEMKSDLNDLKNLVFELIQSNDLNVSNTSTLRQLQAPSGNNHRSDFRERSDFDFDNQREEEQTVDHDGNTVHQPIIIEPSGKSNYHNDVEVMEESLSLADAERELIKKALKKHNSRRKEAAKDLGISERTLYRKIKEYEL